MEIEVKALMSDNEMLSHIFLGCIPREQLMEIRDRYIKPGSDWRKDITSIPVEMTIGGIEVNPKVFFDSWKRQMQNMITKEAKKLVSEKMGSQKMRELQNKLYGFEQILETWESEINWDVENPLNKNYDRSKKTRRAHVKRQN